MPFFNKIRKTLLPSSGLKRYLAYAIGEILLVVIGMLIALEINDWAQNRAERKQERVILGNLISDLKEELILQKELIQVENNYFSKATATFDHFAKQGGFNHMDSTLSTLNSLHLRRTFNPVNATFKEMTSSGSIKLIQNDSLKRAILKYYHFQERVALVVMNNNARHVDQNFVSNILDKTLIGEFDRTGLPVKPEDILRNEKLDNVPAHGLKKVSASQLANPKNALVLYNALKLRAIVASIHISQYTALEKETNKLLTQLERERQDR